MSLAPTFRHQWPSIYAITDAKIDVERLNLICLAQVPQRQSLYYALDVMNVRRAESETLKDRMICHGAKREAYGNGVVLGLPYSLLAFTENANSSWAMTVNCERVKPDEKAVSVAVKQIEWLFENSERQAETSVGLDGGYGNVGFFCGLHGEKAFAVARMRNDRKMYRRPERREKGRGNQAKYGEKFKFNEPESLGRGGRNNRIWRRETRIGENREVESVEISSSQKSRRNRSDEVADPFGAKRTAEAAMVRDS